MSYHGQKTDAALDGASALNPNRISEAMSVFRDSVSSKNPVDTVLSPSSTSTARGAGPAKRLEAVRDESAEIAAKIVASFQVRKYRRAPAFRENLLLERVQSAMHTGEPLEFLAFWGCGDRGDIAPVDERAFESMKALTAEPKHFADVRSHTKVVFMDVHARLNGRAEAHFNHYFHVIQSAQQDENTSFQRESQTFDRYGLTIDAIVEYERSDEFNEFWFNFPLREKFVTQASRHSNSSDPAYAARRYLATCRKERLLFAAAFPNAIFLTYNGPDFNECFPDIPTLYIYPGPRGPTVKPWFR